MTAMTRSTLAAVTLAVVAGSAFADLYQKPIKNEQDSVNAHYEIASKDFGNGQVQMHSMAEGPDGKSHTVYSFNCTDKKYDLLFDGPESPDGLFTGPMEEPKRDLDQIDNVAPLAQHACTSHGYPLLKW